MSPFKSKAQARFLFAKKPGVAAEFAAKTGNYKALPEKKGSTMKSKPKSKPKKKGGGY